jgi:hypothetical protein
MRNLHLLPTDKPGSKLIKHKVFNEVKISSLKNLMYWDNANIYITSNEEISGFENNIWVILGTRVFHWQNTMALVFGNKPKKIILTTDTKLIEDGVQAIDDTFLEWFVNNPSCEFIEVKNYPLNFGGTLHKIIIPKEEPKQEIELIDGFIPTSFFDKQETLEFAQWISHNDWVYLPSKNYWVNEEQEELEQKLSSEQILELWFKENKNK